MITISLCMIVKNEEKTLNNCLQSIKGIPDEIIIIDTGSTDQTKNIAKKWTEKVYEFPWIYDFSAARNESFRYATQDYILWLDADDILKPEESERLKKLKSSLDYSIDAVSMKYHVLFNADNQVISSTRRIRLIKREKGFKWEGIVHEDLKCSQPITHSASDIIVTHTKNTSQNPSRNIEIYERAIKKGFSMAIQDYFHYARELTAHKQYLKAIEMYKICLDSPDISLANQLFIYHQLATCYAITGDLEKEHELTLLSFQLDIPQPVFCCRMGEFFIKKQEYEAAVFWYHLAIDIKIPSHHEWSVSQEIYQTWLPHKQLALCYYYLNDYKNSYKHNQQVLIYNSQDKDTLINLEVAKSLLEIQEKRKRFENSSAKLKKVETDIPK
ncbi:glycosyltransferase family 2 protein [Bacillus cereus]|uniref:tetratricopeptide repeat-containing glycosyltransferase family 2 protein n=1 Tax=Bacillus cereus TaxID=1396 RepID=UPI002112A636|nr:glycosyltransferase family 2 protein [Bacillus cereus]HDR4949086.1 glycosyltransferase family 2 protein [Bacillus cereus]